MFTVEFNNDSDPSNKEQVKVLERSFDKILILIRSKRFGKFLLEIGELAISRLVIECYMIFFYLSWCRSCARFL